MTKDPTPQPPKPQLTLTPKQWAQLVAMTSLARDGYRPILNSLYLEVEAFTLKVTGTDHYICGYREFQFAERILPADADPWSVIVPIAAIKTFGQGTRGVFGRTYATEIRTKRSVTISFNGQNVTMKASKTSPSGDSELSVTTTPVSGKYPNYRHILFPEPPLEAKVVKRMNKAQIITYLADRGVRPATGIDTLRKDLVERCDRQVEQWEERASKPMESFMLNPAILIRLIKATGAIVRAKEPTPLRFIATDSMSPVKVMVNNDASWTGLIMPVRA